METTKKIMTQEEKKQHLHNLIQQWKQDMKQAQEELDKKVETPEYQKVLKELKEANAEKGIVIPGEV